MSEIIEMSELQAAGRAAFSGRPEVQCAYAFGSRISGRPRPGSDLDIALVLTPEAMASDPLTPELLANRFEEALDRGIEIDVRAARSLPLTLQGRIVTEGVRIYEGDPVARVEFETDVRRRYFDFLPLIERDAHEGLVAGG